MRERPLARVPSPTRVLLVLALAAQISWHASRPAPVPDPTALPRPPAATALAVASLGEPVVLARLLMLWLQAFDNQPGISIPFRELDYPIVIGWLSRILDLDPAGNYPLLAASRLYGEVPVAEKQRLMLDFVSAQFERDPARRWPWMAHAVYVAKHRMRDLDLSLRYARQLASHAGEAAIPEWATQMEIFVLEDLGEIESAKVLLGGLLASGRIRDPHERYFLTQRLAELEARRPAAGR